jgi:hypothetical protein
MNLLAPVRARAECEDQKYNYCCHTEEGCSGTQPVYDETGACIPLPDPPVGQTIHYKWLASALHRMCRDAIPLEADTPTQCGMDSADVVICGEIRYWVGENCDGVEDGTADVECPNCCGADCVWTV